MAQHSWGRGTVLKGGELGTIIKLSQRMFLSTFIGKEEIL